MPIVEMDKFAPAAEAQSDGRVGLYTSVQDADPDDRYQGFLMSQPVAVQTAIALISAVQDAAPDHAITLPVSSVAMDQGRMGHDDIFRLTFEVLGARIPLELNATQLAELTAALAQVSRDADRSPLL